MHRDLSKTRLFFAAFVLTSAIGFGSSTARAIWDQDLMYFSDNPPGSLTVYSELQVVNDWLRLDGIVGVLGGGSTGWIPLSAGFYAIRATLWTWNGQDPVICEQWVDWHYNQNGEIGRLGTNDGPDTYGCGDGWYNLAVEGFGWVDGAWHGGTTFSGWLFADVNDNPPVLN